MNIKIKNARGSFLKVRNPELNPLKGGLHYGANLIFSEDTKVSLDGNKTWLPGIEGMEKAIELTFQNKFKGKVPAKFENWAFSKADGSGMRDMRNEEGVYTSGYGADTYFVASGKAAERAPQGIPVYGPNTKLLPVESGHPISGDYISAAVFLYAYENGGKKGITAFLEAVQYLRQGEPFGAKPVEGSAFDVEEAEEEECF